MGAGAGDGGGGRGTGGGGRGHRGEDGDGDLPGRDAAHTRRAAKTGRGSDGALTEGGGRLGGRLAEAGSEEEPWGHTGTLQALA